jgi:outer membrane protein assembly factor BamB
VNRFLQIIILCLTTPSLSWANWPHLRGPNYDAVSAEFGLAESWPIDGPPLLWSRELGQGHSGFIVAEEKVFTQRQALGGQFLVCLDPDTGKTLWEHQYDWSWQPRGPYPGPYASPTWHKGKVFYASPTGLVGCIDGRTGQALWSVNVKERFQGKGWDFGYGATPLVEDDRVILPVGGRVRAWWPCTSTTARHSGLLAMSPPATAERCRLPWRAVAW